MNSKQVNGIPVISLADGERLGTIARTYVDPATREVVGFAYDTEGGFFSPGGAPRVDAACIHSLGPDALILDDKASVREEAINRRIDRLVTADELHGRAVLTADGAALGRVASVAFDEHAFCLTAVAVSPGMLTRAWTLPLAKVVTIGSDYVIVVASDELETVPEEDEPTAANGPAEDDRVEGPMDRHEP